MEVVRKVPIKCEDGSKGSHLILKCGHEVYIYSSYQDWTIICLKCESKPGQQRTAARF